MDLHVFGIRHHGPGSARSLRAALEDLQPDALLIEGPPDAAELLPLAAHAEMKPPVALLIYVPEEPRRAVYYPFALFSPEWQAIQYGLANNAAVRFMDLPQAHQMALEDPQRRPDEAEAAAAGEQPRMPDVRADPLGWLAEAAGYSDAERWWEHAVEERLDSTDLFAAVCEAITALRETAPPGRRAEPLREAFMRQTIRAAAREGYKRVAAVCGAWHAPALAEMPAAKHDAALLKGLPRTKVKATWVPWTYGRLTLAGGYGAGIESPGWYDCLWTWRDRVAIRWMTRVARLLREQDIDASAAHVIEAVRLAETLAALRGRPAPGLPELSEATLTVLCFGNDVPMRLIHERLIVGERLGQVPEETPGVPLQQDLVREQKRLRLQPEATRKTVDLDLRKPNDLDRSRLLHRLRLLGIPWGQTQGVSGKSGTFHEVWQLQWQPEFAVALIEAGIWGATILEAATAFARAEADKTTELPALTALVSRVLFADLPEAVSQVMACLETVAALASDVGTLMDALPPMANLLRYGNVRQTDAGMAGHVVDGLVVRICIGLPGACASLNDEAAAEMFGRLLQVNAAVTLLRNPEHLAAWEGVLKQMAEQQGLHGLLAGRCGRLLLESGAAAPDESARRMGLELSPASEPARAAAWVEGFLKGSGLLLLHDQALWQVIDNWVVSLSSETFTQLAPLLRRTFSTFPAPERRQMGERVQRGAAHSETSGDADFDAARAERVLPLVARLLGLASE